MASSGDAAGGLGVSAGGDDADEPGGLAAAGVAATGLGGIAAAAGGAVAAPGGVVGRSRTKISAATPKTSVNAPKSCQVMRHPVSGLPAMNSGAAIPTRMNPKLPPVAASPAANPRSRTPNHAASSPIIGVIAPPLLKPINPAASTASR